jgi:hypothetical protein
MVSRALTDVPGFVARILLLGALLKAGTAQELSLDSLKALALGLPRDSAVARLEVAKVTPTVAATRGRLDHDRIDNVREQANGKIELVWSQQAHTVPDLAGKNRSEAQAALGLAGFSLESSPDEDWTTLNRRHYLRVLYEGDTAHGTVGYQEPGPGKVDGLPPLRLVFGRVTEQTRKLERMPLEQAYGQAKTDGYAIRVDSVLGADEFDEVQQAYLVGEPGKDTVALVWRYRKAVMPKLMGMSLASALETLRVLLRVDAVDTTWGEVRRAPSRPRRLLVRLHGDVANPIRRQSIPGGATVCGLPTVDLWLAGPGLPVWLIAAAGLLGLVIVAFPVVMLRRGRLRRRRLQVVQLGSGHAGPVSPNRKSLWRRVWDSLRPKKDVTRPDVSPVVPKVEAGGTEVRPAEKPASLFGEFGEMIPKLRQKGILPNAILAQYPHSPLAKQHKDPELKKAYDQLRVMAGAVDYGPDYLIAQREFQDLSRNRATPEWTDYRQAHKGIIDASRARRQEPKGAPDQGLQDKDRGPPPEPPSTLEQRFSKLAGKVDTLLGYFEVFLGIRTGPSEAVSYATLSLADLIAAYNRLKRSADRDQQDLFLKGIGAIPVATTGHGAELVHLRRKDQPVWLERVEELSALMVFLRQGRWLALPRFGASLTSSHLAVCFKLGSELERQADARNWVLLEPAACDSSGANRWILRGQGELGLPGSEVKVATPAPTSPASQEPRLIEVRLEGIDRKLETHSTELAEIKRLLIRATGLSQPLVPGGTAGPVPPVVEQVVPPGTVGPDVPQGEVGAQIASAAKPASPDSGQEPPKPAQAEPLKEKPTSALEPVPPAARTEERPATTPKWSSQDPRHLAYLTKWWPEHVRTTAEVPFRDAPGVTPRRSGPEVLVVTTEHGPAGFWLVKLQDKSGFHLYPNPAVFQIEELRMCFTGVPENIRHLDTRKYGFNKPALCKEVSSNRWRLVEQGEIRPRS